MMARSEIRHRNPCRLPSCLLVGLSLMLLQGAGGQDSRNGYWLPPSDSLRILLIYAELVNDPDDPGVFNGWRAGALPPDPGYLFDHRVGPGAEPGGRLTRYYYQASFGRYLLLADHYPEIIRIDYKQAGRHGINQVLDSLLTRSGEDIVTAHGYSVNRGDFDFLSTSRAGQPKPVKADSLIDMVMVIWRVNSRITTDLAAGYCVPWNTHRQIAGMKGMNSYSSFINKDYTASNIIRHEFSHLLLGGNNFHTGGSGAGTRTFMSSAGGFAMLSSWDKSAPVYNAFDRRRLGWRHADQPHEIGAIDPITGEQIPGDLEYGQAFPHGHGEFLLRDFVSSGDAIRIALPYLDPDSTGVLPQWVWLENHQQLEGNIDLWKASSPGIYAYIQVGKETRKGPRTFSGHANYTWPLTALGNHDFLIDRESGLMQTDDGRQNPLSGYNTLIRGAYDLGDRDGSIYRNELFLAGNFKLNGAFLDSADFNIGTYPLFGTAHDAFRPGDKIGPDRNPAALPVLTYRTSSSPRSRPADPAEEDNRHIHLNGISIEVLEQKPDGTIRLRVRWDDTRISRNVRWCGNIHLHEPMQLDKKVVLLLDQGYTPQQPIRPMILSGQQVFADTTRLVMDGGSSMEIDRRAEIRLENRSRLILTAGSRIKMQRCAKIRLAPGSVLRIAEGAEILGRGRIILENGARLETDGKDPGVPVRRRRR